MNSKIDYIEFPAKNIPQLKGFYINCFGWKFTDYGPDYTSFDDGRITGGFDMSKKELGGSPLIVIYSDNLESIKAKIIENNGKIIKDIYEFPGGKRFHFTDPDGNELAIWSDK
jgi:predicted enzyme related to lactoylglutathione lyase